MAQGIEQVGGTDSFFGWFVCTWTIKDFSKLDFGVGKKIVTEYFQCNEKSPKWILCLYPGGYDNNSVGFVSCLVDVHPKYAFFRMLSGTLCTYTKGILWSVGWKAYGSENGYFAEKTMKREELMRSLINDTLIFIVNITYSNHFMKDPRRLVYPDSSIVSSGEARPSYTIDGIPVDSVMPSNSQHFYVHSVIIRAYCKAIDRMFVAGTRGEKKVCVKLTDIRKGLMESFIELVYTGNIVSMDICKALELLPLHTPFESEVLRGYCTHYLQTQLSNENVCNILVKGYFLDGELKAKCISYFLECWNPKFLENHRSVLVKYPTLLIDILMAIAERDQQPPLQ